MKTILLNMLLLLNLNIYSQQQLGSDLYGLSNIDLFGSSLSMSSNGMRFIVSGKDNGNSLGYTKVFEWVSNDWVQIGNTLFGEIGELFGYEVFISGDGSKIAITSLHGTTVKVYEFINNDWVQLGGEIIGNINDFFGHTISLSENGNIIAIGGFGNNINGNQAGYVQVYTYSSGNWVQLGSDIYGGAGDNFGFSVDLSSSGNILAASAVSHNNGRGQVKLFDFVNTDWISTAIIPGIANGEGSGFSIDLNNTGNVIAIGAPFNQTNGLETGQVRVYEKVGNNWSQKGNSINGSTQFGSACGETVSLSSNGMVVAAGSPGSNNEAGDVRIFYFENNNWVQAGNSIIGEQIEAYSSTGLSSSGTMERIAVGAPNYSNVFVNDGQAKVFDMSGVLNLSTQIINEPVIYPNPFNDVLNIKTSQGMQISNIILLNVVGQIINEYKNLTLDLSRLQSGVYFLTISTDKGHFTKKILKN